MSFALQLTAGEEKNTLSRTVKKVSQLVIFEKLAQLMFLG